MAMEDAVCLSHMVATHDSLDAAFAAYCGRRTVRTGRVQMSSRAIGEYIYHPAGAMAAVRDSVMRAKSPQDWYDTLAWLYGGNGLDDAPARRAG